MPQTTKKLALIIYATLFLLPAMIHFWPGEPSSKINYRPLKQLPEVPTNWREVQSYTVAVDAYLYDHFGLRERYLKTANRIRYYLFNELMSNQITVGEDGFIFYNSHASDRPGQMFYESCNQARFAASYIQEIERGFASYLSYLHDKQLQAHVAIIPIKARVYPEKLPPLERQWCAKDDDHWIDALVAGLNQVREKVYHPLALMRALKKDIQVYLPIYFHWHGETPRVIAQHMMKTLWGLDAQRHSVEPQQVKETSDLRAHLIGLKFRNESVKYDYEQDGVVACSGSACVPGLAQFFEQAPLAYTYLSPVQDGPVLLVVADSFGQYITPHFIRGFARVVQVDASHMKADQVWAFYEHVLTTVQPTHVLNLLHEGGISGFNKLNQLLLKQQQAAKNH